MAALSRLNSSWTTALARRPTGSFLRPFCLAVTSTSILIAKVTQLYAYSDALTVPGILLWGPTFFLQDIAVILLCRVLFFARASTKIRRSILDFLVIFSSFITLFIAAAGLSFLFLTGTAIRWQQAKTFPRDAAGLQTLLYGSTICTIAAVVIVCMALPIAPLVYVVSGKLLQNIVQVYRALSVLSQRHKAGSLQLHAPHKSLNGAFEYGRNEWAPCGRGFLDGGRQGSVKFDTHGRAPLSFLRVAILLCITLRVLRPTSPVYEQLSRTIPLLDLLSPDHHDSSGFMEGYSFPSTQGKGCLMPVEKFDWLPADEVAGFEDWYLHDNETDLLHHMPTHKCENMASDLLEPIRQSIESNGVRIKHVVLIELESTRYDLFPLVKDNAMWDHIATTFPDGVVPPDVEDSLGELTRNAQSLTGMNAFVKDVSTHRGGITASNAFTTSTYTLKSALSSLCGIDPLAVDFNQEYKHRTYQPCLPHIFDVFNQQPLSGAKSKEESFVTWPWKSVWMQSATEKYDSQAALTSAFGFNSSITRETLVDRESPYFPPKNKDINYFGLPDAELKPYLRDVFEAAERDHERLFLAHLTSATHHPWGLPDEYESKQYLGKTNYGRHRRLNRFLNTIGYVDAWLGEILSLLEELQIDNETLIVLVGDHGLSLPEDAASTVYNNPHVSGVHVPLVFSLPGLALTKIDAPVSNIQILPTLLDLLISTSSLTPTASRVAADLLPLYEGRSLLRHQVNPAGCSVWQVTVMNPGGSWLAVRSTTSSYRLIIPLVAENPWRFSDLTSDPTELTPIWEYSWPDLEKMIWVRYGATASGWAEDAARAGRSWIAQNKCLWRHEKS